MNVDGIFIPILRIAMIVVRVSSLFIFFPVLSQSVVPGLVKVAATVGIAIALLGKVGPQLPAWTLSSLPDLATLVAFVLKEFLIGAGMALVAKWIFSACVASAQWIATQMGFSMGGLFDPELQSSESAWSEFNQWMLVMVFFSIGGHLLFIQALAESYFVRIDDLGSRLLDINQSLAFWTEIGGRFFIWMLKLSGPMAVVLILIQVALGVLSKFIPQVNVWSVSLPITLGAGVLVFTFLSPLYGDALSALLNVNFESNYLWLKFLGAR